MVTPHQDGPNPASVWTGPTSFSAITRSHTEALIFAGVLSTRLAFEALLCRKNAVP